MFQCCMHQLIEALHGIEIIADDFVAISYGDMYEDALLDHDKNLRELLHTMMQVKKFPFECR